MRLPSISASVIILTMIAAACESDEPHPNDLTIRLSGEQAPVALQAQLEVTVSDACKAPDKPCMTGRCCETQMVERVTASTADPIASVQVDDTRVIVVPTAPGMTTLRVTATLGGATAEKTRTVEFVQADRIEVDAPQAIRPGGDDAIAACLPPVRVEVGARGYVPYRAFAGTTWLVTTALQPFGFDGGAITLGPTGGLPRKSLVYFDAVSAGAGTLRTTIGEETTVDFEVVSAAAIDGIDIAPNGSLQLPVTDTIDVDVFATAAGRRLCSDLRERVVIVETPTVCNVDGIQAWRHDGGPTMAQMPAGVLGLNIRGLAVGTCRLRAGLVGTALEDVNEFPVEMP